LAVTTSRHPRQDGGVVKAGAREAHFPAIEKKYGKPAKYWLSLLAKLKASKYAEQMAFLQEKHGFTRAHANAIVMFHRGSKSSKRHSSPSEYFAKHPAAQARTMKAIFKSAQTKHPKLKLVIAWNHPMLRTPEGKYVFGVSASKNHITLNPFSGSVIEELRPHLGQYVVKKYTFQVPNDWRPNATLLNAMVRSRLAELKAEHD
jgi:uncharacterized protein YdhG (YjbR/CyaY superfamily)